MTTKLLTVSLCVLLLCACRPNKAAETRQHALRYFSADQPLVRVSVAKSYYWQTVVHDCPICVYPVNDIITTFKVEECYAGNIPEGTLIACFHRNQTEKSLKEGDAYIFPLDKPADQLQFLDTGVLTPVDKISKRHR